MMIAKVIVSNTGYDTECFCLTNQTDLSLPGQKVWNTTVSFISRCLLIPAHQTTFTVSDFYQQKAVTLKLLELLEITLSDRKQKDLKNIHFLKQLS